MESMIMKASFWLIGLSFFLLFVGVLVPLGTNQHLDPLTVMVGWALAFFGYGSYVNEAECHLARYEPKHIKPRQTAARS